MRGLLSTVEGTAVSQARRLMDERGRVGTGDAYTAWVIRGLLLGHAAQEVVEFAAAAAHLKQSIAGDVNIASVAEVEHALETTGPARLRRRARGRFRTGTPREGSWQTGDRAMGPAVGEYAHRVLSDQGQSGDPAGPKGLPPNLAD